LNICRVNLNDYDYDGRTALHIASSEGNLEAVHYLVNHGADIETRDLRNNTPIDDAIREKRMEVVKFLQEKLDESKKRVRRRSLVNTFLEKLKEHR
jgi:ankyrin repeat protein